MKKEPLNRKIKPPCATCPYKLGLVHTLVNPCPECKADNYLAYDWFKNRVKCEGGDVRDGTKQTDGCDSV